MIGRKICGCLALAISPLLFTNCVGGELPGEGGTEAIGTAHEALTATLVLQPDAAAGKDASAFSLYPDQTAANFVRVGADAWTWSGVPGKHRGFIEFDLSQIPAGATVTSATLELTGLPSPYLVWELSTLTGSNESYVRRVLDAWDESTLTWNNQPASTNEDEVLIPASTSNTQSYDIDVTEMVKHMAVPGQNHGFSIQLATEEHYRSTEFASSDDTNANVHPKLTIQYKTACAPISDSNEQKYWYYRNRLVNDFMIVGDGPGHSLPASYRGAGYQNGSLKFGDTTIGLGWYIGVLATEYRLLADNGSDTTRTLSELYYALRAFNRLDESAETFYGGQPSLNGWFIRDDVHGDLLKDPAVEAHFNSGKFSPSKVTYVNSDFADYPQPVDESLDQVWHVMMGTALVSRFVDPSASYQGMNVVQEARDITTRVVDHMRSANWVIKNPVTGDCRSCKAGSGCGITNPCGANAKSLSFGAATAACRIVYGNPFCPQFQDGTSLKNATVWQAMLAAPATEEDWKYQLLSAIGSVWPADKLAHRAEKRRFEVLPLLHQAIFGGSNGIDSGLYDCLIGSAPCDGPYNKSSNGSRDYPTYEWSTTSRAYDPLRRGDLTPGFPGEYNGLDYMMFYNLQRLVQGGPTPGYDACHVEDDAPTSCAAPARSDDMCTKEKADHAWCSYSTECMSGACGGCIIDGLGHCFEDNSKSLGESCVADRECVSGRCGADCLNTGKCLCKKDTDCGSGEFCGWGLNSGKCMTKRADHALCSQDAECQSGNCKGLIGGTGWCYTPSSTGIGATCHVNEECTTGRCIDLTQKCGCNSDSDCGGGQFCGTLLNSGKCINKRGRNSPCLHDYECASGSCRNLAHICK